MESSTQVNPKEWPKAKKWRQISVMALFTMLGPMSSSFPAPALDQISEDLGIASQVERTMIVSIFVAGFAFGPLFIAPLSEMYGRVIALQASNVAFIIFNLACGFVSTKSQLLVLRFLAGVSGSGAMSIGAGMVSDCFAPENRGFAIAIYAAGIVVGPGIGPIAGAYIATYSTWRWIFWSSSILSVVIAILGLFLMRESHVPTIQARRQRKAADKHTNELYTFEDPQVLSKALIRPFKLMFTQPIIIVLNLYIGFLYGVVYLAFSTLYSIYTSKLYYHERSDTAGFHYIALTLGFFLGGQIRAPLGDYFFHRLKARAGGTIRPEYRLPPIVLGAVLAPVGLLIYGWSAEKKVFWALTDVGVAIFAAGSNINFASTQAYIVDTYTINAGSAMAASTVLRSLAGFALPLIGPAMYERLGLGWGNTVLALICVAIGVPSPILLWIFGEQLRSTGRFAAVADS